MEEVAEFEAECMVGGWNVTHPVGCLVPDLIIPDTTPEDFVCQSLTLSEIRCIQLCPEPSGTLSAITFDTEEVIMSYFETENKVLNEVETNVSFSCKDESKYLHCN